MPFDAFLKLDGIKGESTDKQHKDEIEVLSFSFGVTHAATPIGAGGVPRADVQDFSIVKNTDVASPKLFVTACAGQRIQQALFSVRRRAGGASQTADMLRITLTDVLVSSVTPGGSAGGASDRPMETVSFDFSKIEIEYTPATTGVPKPPKVSCETHKT